MKSKARLYCPQIMAILLALSFGLRAYAESPREELAHAFYLLKTANADYAGHRGVAMHAVEAAGRDLGLDLKGNLPSAERQWKSDDQLREARRLLADSRDKLEQRDRNRVADRVDTAIREIDAALSGHTEIPHVEVPHVEVPHVEVPHVEAPRDELAHAFYLLKTANANYAGHRGVAMQAIQSAGRDLGIDLRGNLPSAERQWKSDDQLREARRLLADSRVKLEQRDRDRVADRVDKAIREIDAALAVR